MLATALMPTTLQGWMKDHPQLPGLIFAALCLAVLFLVILPRLASRLRGKGRPVLDPVQVDELLMGSGALVVDLRDPAAFRSGHVRGSLHVPFPELATRLAAPDPKASRPLVLVDETDALAHRAYEILTRRGFTWMYVMAGGMKAWRRANRPLAK